MPAVKPIDNRIVQAAKGGSLAAFEQILFAYEKVIFNYIFRLTGHLQTTEDLTQETFIKIYKNLKFIKTDGNFQSWIYKIATNTTYDWLRKKKRMNETLFDPKDMDFETTADDTAYQELDKAFTGEIVHKTLEGLKPIYKSVLMLYYYYDFSYQEIADTLSVPINTVKTYLHRAKLAFKEQLINSPV